MSLLHRSRDTQRRGKPRLPWVPPRQWKLWSQPRPVIVLVLLVDALAVALAIGSVPLLPLTRQDAIWAGILLAAAVVHMEVARGLERRREVAAEGTPYVNLNSMWVFAAVLLLPPPFVVAVIVVIYWHDWWRVNRRIVVYRKVFSAATVVFGAAAAAGIIAAGSPSGYPGVPQGLIGLAILVLAALAYWFLNYALVVCAILLSSPQTPGRQALGNMADQLVVAAGLGLGTALAAMLARSPVLVPVLMVTVLALHRGLLLPQFQHASHTDRKTGLSEAVFWREMADKELARARRLGDSVGVLILDLDHFKQVNDRYGHLAGDDVLQAVAEAIKHEVRAYDLVGRLGGEEFALLLPGVGDDEIGHTAERLRQRVMLLRVTVSTRDGRDEIVDGLTASVGGAAYPTAGVRLDQLLLAADSALYAAKRDGRNRTQLAPPTPVELPARFPPREVPPHTEN